MICTSYEFVLNYTSAFLLLYLLFYKFVHCARTKQKAKIKNQRNY